MEAFGQRLAAAVSERGPLCPGIDPHPELLRAWGLSTDANGLAAFSDICVTAFAGFAMVKPQVAFFEAYGSAGFAVLEHTMAALREAGALVLADAKRGDIGSTMAAYAAAWAGASPLAADAVTASPYLGFGSLQPLLDTAAANGRGVFVLAATSNPEGPTVQRAMAGSRTVAQSVVDDVARVNRAEVNRTDANRAEANRAEVDRAEVNRMAAHSTGSVGVVVGATVTDLPDLSALGGPVLVPGVGAQGGRTDALGGFGGARLVLPTVSREVLRAGPAAADLRAAAERLRDEVAYLV